MFDNASQIRNEKFEHKLLLFCKVNDLFLLSLCLVQWEKILLPIRGVKENQGSFIKTQTPPKRNRGRAKEIH